MKKFIKQYLHIMILGTILILSGAFLMLLPVMGGKETKKIQNRLMETLKSGDTVYVDRIFHVEELLKANTTEKPLEWPENAKPKSNADETPSQAAGDQVSPAPKETGTEKEALQVSEDELALNCIGILSIPKIDVELPIVEGLTEENLDYALAHMYKSAAIGEEGSCCIFGHRSHTYGKYFNRLDELMEGDTITIETTGSVTYEYVVEKKEVLLPDDPTLPDGGLPGRILSLITCHPTGVASHRLVIRARQIRAALLP